LQSDSNTDDDDCLKHMYTCTNYHLMYMILIYMICAELISVHCPDNSYPVSKLRICR